MARFDVPQLKDKTKEARIALKKLLHYQVIRDEHF